MADKQSRADSALYKRWQSRIEKEKRAHDKFRKQAEKAAHAARDDDESKQHAFNIWWSTCTIVRSAVYGSIPKPDVRRRFQKANPEEKNLARLVERAIEYQIDTSPFGAASNAVVKDYIEAGLGVPRVVLDVQTQPTLGPDGTEGEEIVSQSVTVEHVPWSHFHWEPGKSWENCDWVAFESFHPRKTLEAEYGVEIKSGKDNDSAKREAEEYADEVQVYEIWHKPARKVYVYASCHPKLLEERDDPLRLEGFFPCPRPLFSNLKSDELIPKPDYQFIEPQIIELNRVTMRIKSLVNQVRANGFTDAAIAKEIGGLVSEPDGTIKPVVNLLERLQGLPSDRLVTYLPIVEMIQTIQQLESEREQIKQQIYEVIGISDIVRGATQASETAAAQQLKGQWANVRLSHKTNDVARLWRDCFRIFAEIICEHFSPQVLMLQTGIEITPNMLQMMQSDIGRNFAIDVETDSTLAQDDFENRQQATEFVGTILQNLERLTPAIMGGALPVEFVQETLAFVVAQFKHGKQLEDAVNGLGQHWAQMQPMQQQLQQMQQAIEERDMQLQQAGQQLQQLQGQLEQVDMAENARKDAEIQAKLQRETVDTEAQAIENAIVKRKFGLDQMEQQADIGKTVAETAKIRAETNVVGLRPNNAQA